MSPIAAVELSSGECSASSQRFNSYSTMAVFASGSTSIDGPLTASSARRRGKNSDSASTIVVLTSSAEGILKPILGATRAALSPCVSVYRRRVHGFRLSGRHRLLRRLDHIPARSLKVLLPGYNRMLSIQLRISVLSVVLERLVVRLTLDQALAQLLINRRKHLGERLP